MTSDPAIVKAAARAMCDFDGLIPEDQEYWLHKATLAVIAIIPLITVRARADAIEEAAKVTDAAVEEACGLEVLRVTKEIAADIRSLLITPADRAAALSELAEMDADLILTPPAKEP